MKARLKVSQQKVIVYIISLCYVSRIGKSWRHKVDLWLPEAEQMGPVESVDGDGFLFDIMKRL